ncbi:unnamed protein product [Orchesella dallaii]|uniref:BED-type domain-containing protein n=1 Tax=Orchesella dallaii TaxID=48710 RepID=A0ABP1PPG8_9HEXA
MSSKSVTKGKKLYNPDWKQHPVLESWIHPHTKDNGKAYCYFCFNPVRAQKNDLMEHSMTRKHKMNYRNQAGEHKYFEYCKVLAGSTKKPRKMRRTSQSSKSKQKSSTSTTLPFQEKSAIELNCQPVPVVIVLDDDEAVNGSVGGLVPNATDNGSKTSTSTNCDSGMEMESAVENMICDDGLVYEGQEAPRNLIIYVEDQSPQSTTSLEPTQAANSLANFSGVEFPNSFIIHVEEQSPQSTTNLEPTQATNILTNFAGAEAGSFNGMAFTGISKLEETMEFSIEHGAGLEHFHLVTTSDGNNTVTNTTIDELHVEIVGATTERSTVPVVIQNPQLTTSNLTFQQIMIAIDSHAFSASELSSIRDAAIKKIGNHSSPSNPVNTSMEIQNSDDTIEALQVDALAGIHNSNIFEEEINSELDFDEPNDDDDEGNLDEPYIPAQAGERVLTFK